MSSPVIKKILRRYPEMLDVSYLVLTKNEVEELLKYLGYSFNEDLPSDV